MLQKMMTFQAYVLWQHRISQSHLTTFVINYSGSHGKESACNAGELGSVPGSWRSPGGGHGNHPSVLAWRIPMDRGAWQATVHWITKSQTWLKWLNMLKPPKELNVKSHSSYFIILKAKKVPLYPFTIVKNKETLQEGSIWLVQIWNTCPCHKPI